MFNLLLRAGSRLEVAQITPTGTHNTTNDTTRHVSDSDSLLPFPLPTLNTSTIFLEDK